jgi:hypothetical protein
VIPSINVFSLFLIVVIVSSKSDLNFNQIPSEIKYFIPGKETVNDIPNLFGSLQKMKIPQVQSDIDFEVVVMSKIKQEICFVVVMLSLSMFICLMTSLL